MTSRTRLLPLAVVLLLPLAGWAEVKIPLECRVKNRPPGRCGWCALETLARHHGVKSLYTLTDDHDCRACPEDLEETLIAYGIAYRIQYPGNESTKILDHAIRKNRGAVVGFRGLTPDSGGHIVTLVDFGPEEVRVIDSNDADRRVRTMTRERFLHWWDGFALVPEFTRKSLPKAR